MCVLHNRLKNYGDIKSAEYGKIVDFDSCFFLFCWILDSKKFYGWRIM